MNPTTVAPVTGNAATAKVGQAGDVTIKLEAGGFAHLSPHILKTDPNQPRKAFDKEDLDALVRSVTRYGVLQAVLVKDDGEGNFVIVAGERRVRAAKEAGLEEIPVMITSGETDELAIVENAVRADLTAVEEAEALNLLKTRKGLKGKELATIIGKSEKTVSDILKVCRLPDAVRDDARARKDITRAELMEIAGKEKSSKAMQADYDRLIASKTVTEDQPEAAKADTDKTKATLKKLVSAANSFVKALDEIDLEAMDKEAQERVSDAIDKVANAINGKRPENNLAA